MNEKNNRVKINNNSINESSTLPAQPELLAQNIVIEEEFTFVKRD